MKVSNNIVNVQINSMCKSMALALALSSMGFNIIFCGSGKAQIIPTERTQTRVNINKGSLVDTIEVRGGKVSGGNLVHEFDEYNLRQNERGVFLNSPNIENIFSVVTGQSSSQINGTISTLQPSNLYLINSNGIFFGDNARLNINGSFIATTASDLFFNNGDSLLQNIASGNHTATSPVQLVFNGTSGGISLTGSGHNLNQLPIPTGQSSIIGAGESRDGLRVPKEHSIAFLGNGLSFDGGVATSSHLEVGSINIGTVDISKFNIDGNEDKVQYEPNSILSDILLDNLSLLDSSNEDIGVINVRGANLKLNESSFILNQSKEKGGVISISIDEDVEILGSTEDYNTTPFAVPIRTNSGIVSEVISGEGAFLSINARNLFLDNAGSIISTAMGNAVGGDIYVSVTDDIAVNGDSFNNPLINYSQISSFGRDSSVGGSVNLQSKNLFLSEHGSVGTFNLSTRDSRLVSIDVSEDILISGVSPVSGLRSFINATSLSSGDAGSLVVRARNLSVLDGSSVGSFINSSGNGGNVSVNLSGNLFLSDPRQSSGARELRSSSISSTASVLPFSLRQIFSLPDIPSGNSASVKIRAKDVVLDGGSVFAFNQGTGATGNISIQSTNLFSEDGRISTQADNNNGGNINLNISESSIFTGQSELLTESISAGNGGDINIISGLLFLGDQTRVIADSGDFGGGNINISSEGFFQSQGSLLSSSSGIGPQLDGIIEIDVERKQEVNDQVEIVQPKAEKVALTCSAGSSGSRNSFSIQGSGGFATQPRNFSRMVPTDSERSAETQVTLSAPYMHDKDSGRKIFIIEPTSFLRQADGTLAFAVSTKIQGQERNVLVSSACLKSAVSKS